MVAVLGVVTVVAIAAVAVPYIYIHFIEGPAPAKLELPKVSGTTSTSGASQGSAIAASSLSGTWNVGSGSLAGYRVQEVLVGQNSTTVGRTSEIWGSITITGSTVTKGTFSVNMASVESDQSERNTHFDGPIMDVSQYPTATLTGSSPISLGSIPADGVVEHYNATGTLDMHGVTKDCHVQRLGRAGRQRDRRPDRHHHPLLGMGHLEPQHRRLRHHGKHRDPRGPPPPDPRDGKPGFDLVRLEQLERWRWSDHGAEHDGPSPHRPVRLTPAAGTNAVARTVVAGCHRAFVPEVASTHGAVVPGTIASEGSSPA